MSCCDDTAHQQIPPGARPRQRVRRRPLPQPLRRHRGVSARGASSARPNGTVLTWDPSPPSGAPTALSLGQVAQFDATAPSSSSSQDSTHPFYVSAHMTGAAPFDPTQQDGGSRPPPPDGRGDAEFVNVIPPDEYRRRLRLLHRSHVPRDGPGHRAGPAGPSGFADVTLDCAGTLTGWQPIGTSGKYQYTRFDLVTGNFQGTGNCNNGRHEMSSSVPFGVTVWGWGSAATGQVGIGLLHAVRELRLPGGSGRRPHQPGRHSADHAVTGVRYVPHALVVRPAPFLPLLACGGAPEPRGGSGRHRARADGPASSPAPSAARGAGGARRPERAGEGMRGLGRARTRRASTSRRSPADRPSGAPGTGSVTLVFGEHDTFAEVQDALVDRAGDPLDRRLRACTRPGGSRSAASSSRPRATGSR